MINKSTMDTRKVLGQNIQRYRLFRRMGGEELGKKVGLTKETISRLENAKEKNIGLDYLIKIAQELNVPLEELFIRDGNLLSLKFVISEHNIDTLKEFLHNRNNTSLLHNTMKRVEKMTGVRFKFHHLRHAFTTSLVEKGVDFVTIGAILGHSSISMSLIYSHTDEEKMRRAVDLLDT